MRISLRKSNPLFTSLAVLAILVGITISAPMLSRAHATATSVTIVNNSSHEIRHVFLAPTDQTWGPDQLNNSSISSGGGSVTLSDVSCDGASVKIVAEDQDGCFFYQTINCSQATTWTIGNDTTRDCGN